MLQHSDLSTDRLRRDFVGPDRILFSLQIQPNGQRTRKRPAMADPREAVVRKYRAKMIEHKTMEAQVKKGAFRGLLEFQL
jgi:hypothetical protein